MEYRVLGEYSTRYPSPPNFPDKVTARIGRVWHVGSRGSTSSIPFPRFSELESKNSEKLRDIGKLSGLLVTRAHRVRTDLLSLVKVEIKVDLENCNILSLSFPPQLDRLSNFRGPFTRLLGTRVGLLLIYLE